MSFKRAGDDHCALRLQKKQRVTELLGDDIPANEASKTRSGRFVCLVCPHNPVLDTMAMLALHRQGKKHVANMAIKVEKEHDLSAMFQKRKQEMYLRKDAKTEGTPFGSNHMFSKHTKDDRPLLERTRELTKAITDQKQSVNSNRTTNRFVDCETAPNMRKHEKRSKPFFQSKVEFQLSKKFGDKCSNKFPEAVSNKGHHLLSIKGSVKEKLVQNSNDCSVSCSSSQNSIGKTSSKNADVVTCKKSTEMIQRQQRYIELRKSGWIVDRRGQWVKDENAEFDSDEDEPSPN